MISSEAITDGQTSDDGGNGRVHPGPGTQETPWPGVQGRRRTGPLGPSAARSCLAGGPGGSAGPSSTSRSVGGVGTSLGEQGVNINAAAVGREGASDLAVMAVTTDSAVPDAVVDQIAQSDGFVSGRSITL